MSNYKYSSIYNFGPNMHSDMTSPLSYCIGQNINQEFNHSPTGVLYGQNSKKCQLFMSNYCANKWDKFCEIASQNNNNQYPNLITDCNISVGKNTLLGNNLTAGEVLLFNTALKKYRKRLLTNCENICEPFDPTVANSPMVCYEASYGCGQGFTKGHCTNCLQKNCQGSNQCLFDYEVDPEKIDNDIVMNKILECPVQYMIILINIYNTAKRKGTLQKLENTKLGTFFKSQKFLDYYKL